MFSERKLFSFQALRVSMEEQRARQEEEARKATAASVAEMSTTRGAEGTRFSQ